MFLSSSDPVRQKYTRSDGSVGWLNFGGRRLRCSTFVLRNGCDGYVNGGKSRRIGNDILPAVACTSVCIKRPFEHLLNAVVGSCESNLVRTLGPLFSPVALYGEHVQLH